MSALQRAEGPAVSVTVTNATSHLKSSRDSARTFGGTERLLKELFERKGLGGEFRLLAERAIRGSNAKKGIHFTNVVEDRIKLSVQPNGNNTNWVYWLSPPKSMTAQQLFDRLTKVETVAKREPPKTAPAPAKPLAELEPKASSPASPTPPANSVPAFLADLDMVALALLDLFPKCDSMPPRALVVEELQGHMDWTPEEAEQAVLGLVNRNCLKEGMLLGEARVQVVGDKLCERLTQLGGIRRRTVPVSSAPATQSTSQRQRDRQQLRGLRRGDVLPGSSAPKAPVPAVKAVPSLKARPTPQTALSQPAFGQSAALEHLAQKAQMFANAQASLAAADPAVNALKERRQRLMGELAGIDSDLARLEEGKASAIAILSDPSYSEAAVRMAQIKALIAQ